MSWQTVTLLQEDRDAPRRALLFARQISQMDENELWKVGQEIAEDLQQTFNYTESLVDNSPGSRAAHCVAVAIYTLHMGFGDPETCLDEIYAQQVSAYQHLFSGNFNVVHFVNGGLQDFSVGDTTGTLIRHWQYDQFGAKLLERGVLRPPTVLDLG